MAIQLGRIDWECARAADGSPALWNGYQFQGFQVAAWRAELAELTLIVDTTDPPWADDDIGHGLYRRAIVNYGTIWYTFVRRAGGRLLVMLVGTCDGVDDHKPAVHASREAHARHFVEDLRRAGILLGP